MMMGWQPPAGSPRRNVQLQWKRLESVAFFRHGSGTSIFTAMLDGISVMVKSPRYGISEEETQAVTEELRHEVSTSIHSSIRQAVRQSVRKAVSRYMYVLVICAFL